MSEAPQRPRHSAAEGGTSRLPRATDRRANTVLEVQYRGGSESKWNVKCRGHRYVLPGWMALEDVMALVHHETGA